MRGPCKRDIYMITVLLCSPSILIDTTILTLNSTEDRSLENKRSCGEYVCSRFNSTNGYYTGICIRYMLLCFKEYYRQYDFYEELCLK